jgi:hypothetical protein
MQTFQKRHEMCAALLRCALRAAPAFFGARVQPHSTIITR